MTAMFPTAMIAPTQGGGESQEMLDHEASDNTPDQTATLTEIMHMVDMHYGVTAEGWTEGTARLFAIDTAMTAIRRNLPTLSEADKHTLTSLMQEARALVVAGRDYELGFIQGAMEAHAALANPGLQRRLWMTAVDALLPSPYRAALVSTRNALALGTNDGFADVANLLRDRLLARLGEGSLLSEPDIGLFRTA